MNHTQKLLAATILTSTIISTPAFSQDGVLDEIIVTAERRSESIQDVPIAITAVTTEALTEAGIDSSLDLQFVTPGLNIGTQLTGAVPFIRGVGTQSTAAGQDSGVATYVDDVYYSSTVGSVLALANIERIEVLKGPQGTLFGRNATGGLMHVITKDPSEEFSGNLEVSYGNFETLGASAYLTGGIADGLSTDLAVYFKDQGEGYGTNLASGEDVNATDELVIRNKWLYSVNEDTEFKLSLDYGKVETSQGPSLRLAEGALGVDGAATFGFLVTPVANGGAGLTPAQAFPLAQAAASTFTGDFQDVDADLEPFAEIEQYGGSLVVNHRFGDIDLTSVTAYREADASQQLSQAGIDFNNFLDVRLNQFTESFTQELRLSSNFDNFDWILGGFFLDEKAGYNPTEILGVATMGQAIRDNNQQDTTSYAVFAQGDYHLTDATTITAGLRYTKDKRVLTGDVSVAVGGTTVATFPEFSTVTAITDPDDAGQTVPFSNEANFDELTWRLALSHEFNADTLGYVSYNRGFKAGLFNLNVLSAANGGQPFLPVEPEILDAYEVGLKTEFFDNRMRLNLSAFLYDYKDLQVSISTEGGNTILNAAEATMKGGEIEFLAALSSSVTLNAGLSLLDAEYDSFPAGPVLTPNGFGGNTQTAEDLAGNEIPRSPEMTFNAGIVHTLDTSVGKFTSSANVYHNDGFYWESDNRHAQESYSIVNAQVTWSHPDDSYYVRGFVNNVTDTEYSNFGLASELGDFISAAAPRTYGVKVGVNF